MNAASPPMRIFPPPWDLRWLRYTLSALTLAALSVNAINLSDMPLPAYFPWVAWELNILFGVLLMMYGGHLLIYRLQCSLLDLVVIVAFAGNILGIFLTVPGLRSLILQLMPAALGWVLLGAAEGIVYARILDCRSQFRRVLLFLVAWGQFLASPFLLLSWFLFTLKDNGYSRWFGADFLSYRYPFLVTGIAIFALAWIVHGRIRAAIRLKCKTDLRTLPR
jgi:hypothetical protein